MMKNIAAHRARIRFIRFLSLVIGVMLSFHINAQIESTNKRRNLIILNPSHPHGAQIQNSLRSAFHADVHVYAPLKNDLEASYLNTINRYNKSDTVHHPWKIHIHIGDDYLEKMLKNSHGDVVIVASSNLLKSDYILRAVNAGFSVIADKPMALTSSDFMNLTEAFAIAETHDRFVSDLPAMSMRNWVTCLLQKELASIPEVFGTLEKGSIKDPAVVQENLHYYYKAIQRPTWFFDVKQQGNGVTDVTTHLADLVLWTFFSEETVHYEKDIQILSAKLWPTMIKPGQFKKAARVEPYPDFLTSYLKGDMLEVFSNGEINLKIKETHMRIATRWDFEPPAGKSDTHTSILRGSRVTLRINPGDPLNLYIEPSRKMDSKELGEKLQDYFEQLQGQYPFISLHKEKNGWRISTERKSIKKEDNIEFPSQQEVSHMLAKYYITTQADSVAEKTQ